MAKDERPSIADTAAAPEPSAEFPRLDSLARHSSGGRKTTADDATADGSDIPADGSYAPLADALHRSKPVPKPTGLEPGDMVMKPVKRLSQSDRVKAIVDKTIRSAVAKGSIEPEAGDALLAGRYSQWLDEQAAKAKAAKSDAPDAPAPRRHGPGSGP